jgi:hypothetical protein
VPSLAWRWDSLAGEPGGTTAPGGLGPGWVLARSLDRAGRLAARPRPAAGPGRGRGAGPVGFLADEVVRVLAWDPASCRPEMTRMSGYVTASFQALGGSWLPIDWDAIRLPTGITAPR